MARIFSSNGKLLNRRLSNVSNCIRDVQGGSTTKRRVTAGEHDNHATLSRDIIQHAAISGDPSPKPHFRLVCKLPLSLAYKTDLSQ